MKKFCWLIGVLFAVLMLSSLNGYSQENKEKKSKKKGKTETTTAQSQIDSTSNTKSNIINNESEIRLRLMMVEAMLELNEAMLEGVKASIDTLNLPENKNALNSKDMNTTLLRMKRNRDKTLLMPYLEHVQDSLRTEITALQSEREVLDRILNPNKPMAPVVIKTDTLIAGEDTVVYQTTIDEERGTEKTSVQVITKEDNITKDDLKKSEVKRNEKKKKKFEETTTRNDTVMVYNVSGGKEEPASKSKVKINYADTAMLAKAKNDTSAALKIKLPNSNDSLVIKPVKPKKEKEVAKVDTVSKQQPKSSSVVTANVPADSIKRIKAEFFLARAQNAIEDKSFRNAEQYIDKAIELYPNYFDAWYAKAEMDASTGSISDALKSLHKCEQIDANRPQLYYAMGNLYLKMKKKPEAIKSFEKALHLKSNYVDALMAHGALMVEAKKFNEALADYDNVIKADITHYKAYKARGAVQFELKKFSDAADDYTRFLIFDPKDASAYYFRGIARIANNELMDGCMDLSTASKKGYKEAEAAIKKNCE